MHALGATLASLAILTGCSSVAPPPAPSPAPPRLALAPPAPELQTPPVSAPAPVPSAAPQARELPAHVLSAHELPAHWAEVPLADFVTLVERAFPPNEPRTFVPSAFEELSSALRNHDPISVRAAVLLAHCADPLAGELLLARLERRSAIARDDPVGNALEIGCAAALLEFPATREVGARLESLSYGRTPHPDLEVRVECGRSALALGRDGPIPFLLAILKHGTRLGAASAGWTPIPDMSLCQRRAAEALCQRAGRVCRYRELQALDEREAEIRALEAAFAPARLKAARENP